MKQKILYIISFAAVVTATVISCKKDSGSSPATTTTTTTTSGTTTSSSTTSGTTSGTTTSGTNSGFSFMVNGTLITVDSAYSTLYTLFVPPHNRELDVYAFKGGNQILEFHFLPKTGSQTAGADFAKAWMTYTEFNGTTPLESYDSQSGTLNLTSCDTVGKVIEGTFNFDGKGLINTSSTKSITSGVIKVTRMKKQ